MTTYAWTGSPCVARAALLATALASLSALAGCGGGQTVECTPSCPSGFECTTEGCVRSGGSGSADLSVSGDLAPSCGTCGGNTPYCGANLQCVSCLVDSHCPAGSICKVVGAITACVPGCADDARCGGGTLRCCGGACVDSSKDAQNCGACGNACKPANAGAACAGGQCTAGNCNAGWADCNGDGTDGCESYTRADPANCTGCGKACALANANAACANGCFIASCKYGFDDCNQDPKDGCEIALLSDTKNCGACAKQCGAVSRAQIACSIGTCILTGCSQGFGDCNKQYADGCESNLLIDKNNCGACGNACSGNQVCVNGDCTCPPCSFPNARAACVGRLCVIDSCIQGWGDCDGNNVNGCERNMNTDVNNCGACGKVCAQGLVCTNGACTCPQCNIPNARTVCVNNMCALDQCLPGWGDCDKNPVNGCEVDLTGNPNNCGACGNQCGQQKPYCLGGACADVAKSCAIVKQGNPNAVDGTYTIDPDGNGAIPPTTVYCDMTTDGGGWTLVYASASTDNEVGLASDTLVGGNPLAFGYYNTSRAMKMALSLMSQESLWKRKDGAWIKANAAMYDQQLATPNSHMMHQLVTLTASNGATAQGAIGYTNYNIAGGGDYGVSMYPDGATCQGNTTNGFDHHSANYYHLNCGCQRQYLYSYSNNVQDSDQQYNVNTTLGSWTATQACATVESGGISFYAGMR